MKSGFIRDAKWKLFEMAIDPKRMDARMKRHLRQAAGAAAVIIVGAIREHIKSGKFASNAALTQALKGGADEPLKMTGRHLFPAITHKIVDPFTIWVGIKQSNKFYKLARVVHDGYKIQVTRKMRVMFQTLAEASRGDISPSQLRGRAQKLWRLNKVWYPIGHMTTHIVIPPRPFMEQALTSPDLKKVLRQIWGRVIDKSFKSAARGG